MHEGSWAERIAVAEDAVASRPRSIGMQESGAAPLAGLVALAAFDALAPASGEDVLVVGATGGVGSFFVQLAAGAGATVIAPAKAEDRDYLTGLGVSEILDRDRDLGEAMRELRPDGVSAVLDTTYAPDQSVLAAGGRLASPTGAAGEGEGRFNVMAVPSPENLRRLAALLDEGALRVPIQRTYPLAEAGRALADLHGTHTQGKLAVSLS